MNKHRADLLFLAPLFLFVLLFVLVPVIGALINSLFRDVSFLPVKFTGLMNYIRLSGDSAFRKAVVFTLLFSAVSVFLEMAAGILTASVINEEFRMRGLIRGIVLIPWAIPNVIGARMWQFIYQFEYGVHNFFMKALFGMPENWLGSPAGAFSALVAADVWRTTPFVAIIILAGMQNLPTSIYDQAKVDGAGMIARFFRITLPALKPILLIALIFRTIDALRIFDVILVMTGGGPGGTTSSISLLGYKAFLQGDFGYGSAISVAIFLLAFVIAMVYLKAGRIKEEI